MKINIKAHLWTLPRWFVAPFIAAGCLLGASLAREIDGYAWIAVVASLLVMAGGHSYNSYLDYAWTGLDKGEVAERSAEKDYTGGQSIVAAGTVSLREVLFNANAWYLLSAVPVLYLAVVRTPLVLIPWILGMLITFWYSWAKFNYTHELALGIAMSPLPALMGMYAVNSHPDVAKVLLASVPVAVLLGIIGLALDEWPDAEANLKKGVRSIAYMVWKYSAPASSESTQGLSGTEKDMTLLQWYCTSWFSFLYLYQIYLIVTGVLKPLTGWTFILVPFFMAMMVLMRVNFRKSMRFIVAIAAAYSVVLVITQVIH